MSRQSKRPSLWAILDRYLVWFSSGLMAGVLLVADWLGHELTEGTKAALGSFVAYAALKGKSDAESRKDEKRGEHE